MNIVKIIHIVLFILEATMCIYAICNLAYKKHKFKSGEIKEIKNSKYVIIIIIMVVIFVVYGYMRNIVN